MKIINNDMTLENFNTWSGATETKNVILENDKGEEFDSLIEELHPDGLTETDLNDILWFEDEWLFESLGIDTEEDEDEE